jgi:hypothetical protein
MHGHHVGIIRQLRQAVDLRSRRELQNEIRMRTSKSSVLTALLFLVLSGVVMFSNAARGQHQVQANAVDRTAPRYIPAPHLQLKLTQSDDVVAPGNRVTLVVELALPPDLHVYAPGVQGYKPIVLEMSPNPKAILRPASYPKSRLLLLPAIGENVPVFEGKFRIAQDVILASDKDFSQKAAAGPADGTPLALSGNLRYQACDSKICYPPASVPVSWQVTVLR